MQAQRLGRIDSVRGLAALTVAFFHCIHVFAANGIELVPFYQLHDAKDVIARILLSVFNGGAAVSIFFVISGFVLGRSVRRNNQAWPAAGCSFLLKRVIRLYPTMAVALLAFFLVTFCASLVAPSLIAAPAVKGLRNNLALASPDLLWITWSLFIELGAAPLFIVMALLTRRFGLFVQLGLLAVSVIWLFTTSPQLARPWLLFPLRLYFFLFAIGAALTFADSLVSRMDAKHVPIVLLGGFVILGFSKGLFEASASQWSILLEGIGSAVIVATVAFQTSAPVLRHLDAPIARWLGRISYSFYLYHPLVFLTVLPFAIKLGVADLPLAPALSGALLILITVPPTAALAYASYWLIEIPTIRACASLDALFSARRLRARAST